MAVVEPVAEELVAVVATPAAAARRLLPRLPACSARSTSNHLSRARRAHARDLRGLVLAEITVRSGRFVAAAVVVRAARATLVRIVRADMTADLGHRVLDDLERALHDGGHEERAGRRREGDRRRNRQEPSRRLLPLTRGHDDHALRVALRERALARNITRERDFFDVHVDHLLSKTNLRERAAAFCKACGNAARRSRVARWLEDSDRAM